MNVEYSPDADAHHGMGILVKYTLIQCAVDQRVWENSGGSVKKQLQQIKFHVVDLLLLV